MLKHRTAARSFKIEVRRIRPFCLLRLWRSLYDEQKCLKSAISSSRGFLAYYFTYQAVSLWRVRAIWGSPENRAEKILQKCLREKIRLLQVGVNVSFSKIVTARQKMIHDFSHNFQFVIINKQFSNGLLVIRNDESKGQSSYWLDNLNSCISFFINTRDLETKVPPPSFADFSIFI